ncbi:MAG TPA: iron ABC transporter permease [Paenalcaligenes sp.]|nr:iron ABC transporter permease [Paenalcaligenes sp.]
MPVRTHLLFGTQHRTFSLLRYLKARPWLSLLSVVALLLLVSFYALYVGNEADGVVGVLLALVGQGDEFLSFLLFELRVPRILAAVIAGAGLGAGGCLLQTMARNRLATPNIVGLDNGATAFAIASIVAIPLSLATPLLALMGAATAAALAFGLSGGMGSKGYRFIVMGVGIGAVFGAVTNFMLARTDMDSANAAYPWTVGSLNARPEEAVWWMFFCLVICLPLGAWLTRSLNIMRLSDEVAISLGISMRLTRWMTMMVTVCLTGFAVALTGPVGMIALVAPEAARHIVPADRVSIWHAAAFGSLFLLLADVVGQRLWAPIEIPVGLITAVVGSPYLIWLLLRRQPQQAI